MSPSEYPLLRQLCTKHQNGGAVTLSAPYSVALGYGFLSAPQTPSNDSVPSLHIDEHLPAVGKHEPEVHAALEQVIDGAVVVADRAVDGAARGRRQGLLHAGRTPRGGRAGEGTGAAAATGHTSRRRRCGRLLHPRPAGARGGRGTQSQMHDQ